MATTDRDSVVSSHGTEAQAVAAIVKRAFEPRMIPIGADDRNVARDVLLVPAGLELKSVKVLLDEYRMAPERKQGTAHVTDLDSFVELVNRFRDEDSVIFADKNPRAPALVAILDFDRKGPTGAARFGQHRVRYDFPVTEEWKAWTANSGNKMSQRDFAEFLETRLADLLDATRAGDSSRRFVELHGCSFAAPNRLLELSRNISIHVDHRVQSVLNLSTGEAQIQYTETHSHSDDKTQVPVKVPGAFLIGVAVFQEAQVYQIAARLRYRQAQGSIHFSYDLYRPEAVFDDAITGACKFVVEKTKLPLFAGTPA